MSIDPEKLLTSELDDDDLTGRLAAAGRGTSRLTLTLAAAALAVVSFLGGVAMHSALGGRSPSRPAQAQQQPQQQQPQQQQQARGTAGTIARIEGDTVYLKARDGQEIKVVFSEQTSVMITQRGSARDLAPGDTVAVQGERAEDGTVTARQITEQPAAR
ncbi:DUF5666 domain-containing protein [Allokutzneria sp. A3M-2-11 16]|uniref:DUF5666 domain-containing protein n=1 Tax=Allokutzneria sp. A3M-2-11 16 TaxID=2962043 RepID=UPI0020B85994|nr:DUF5666 domain-containing protein [Allokutzneria sp. A3M-2-11 16]MCP3799103.1 DUF5666 domain-containing protein [Allokutzneria sp. A3M-2-11 16]